MDESKLYTLVIPSATLVPEELWSLGKLPAIIYPVNQEIVFNYLYNQYKRICRLIKIIGFQEFKKIKKALDHYNDKNIVLEKLPKLEDLGYSVYYAIRNIKTPIIINFADTIVLDDIITTPNDSFFYAEDYITDTWTFFEESSGKITKILDKVAETPNKISKLFVGLFKIQNTIHFKKCLEVALKNKTKTENSFYYALRKYSESNPLVPIKSQKWYDIGHSDKYYNSQLEVKTRNFNHISIDKDRGILTKTSENKDKFIGEIKWYLKLPNDIEYVRPRIFNYSLEYNNPFISMEYYSYHTLHELFLYGDLNKRQWNNIFLKIKFVLDDFKRYKVCDEGLLDSLNDIYLQKTKKRLLQLKKQKEFCSFFSKGITINNNKYLSLDDIIIKLDEVIPKYLLNQNKFTIIHGDLCFANIMIDTNLNFIKLVDPRGQFGKYDIYGDFRYELAKLYHSIDGKYDYIIKDLFNITYDFYNAKISFKVLSNKNDKSILKIFHEVFKYELKKHLKEIELIEAILFLSMIPLHNESIKHQFAMLATGLIVLNKVINIEKKG